MSAFKTGFSGSGGGRGGEKKQASYWQSFELNQYYLPKGKRGKHLILTFKIFLNRQTILMCQ